MDNPRELALCDVRCFQGAQRGALRPITLLVGENSTGKTTFLGCYRVLHQAFSQPHLARPPDFNEQPFPMGSFRDIVRSRRGPDGHGDEFRLGLTVDPAADPGAPSYELLATFREEGSQPVIASLRFSFESGAFLDLQRTEAGTTVRIPDRAVETTFPFGDVVFMLHVLMTLAAGAKRRPREVPGMHVVAEALQPLLGEPRVPLELPNLQPIAEYLDGLFPTDAMPLRLPQLPALVPVAPLRARPRRTYDPVREVASPEGEHIPMLLMRLNRGNKDEWDSLHDELVGFGRESGLFTDIRVKRHGRQMSDPFQLQVKVRTGPHANVLDVGYGVSQSLPILVDVMTAPESDGKKQGRGGGGRDGRSFLLQQPEVHLHPRGQAELANLFIEAFRKRGHRFLIETHSDYIVDRVRISVRKGSLKPDDVSILYFEPTGNAVTIHNLTLDEHGNLRDAPAGYRDFFVKETDKLLGFAD